MKDKNIRLIFVMLICFMLEIGYMPAKASESEQNIETPQSSQPVSYYSNGSFPQIERVVNLLSAIPTRQGSLLFIIDHRNREPITEDPFHNFLGFDSGGLKIGLGVRYGLLNNMDIGIYRLNGSAETFDVYEFDVRYRLLRQETHFIDLAIRPGYTLFSQSHGQDASGGFVQLLVNRTFYDRLRLGTGFLYHSDSSNDTKSDQDKNYSAAILSSLEIRILPQLAWGIEMSSNIAGYRSAHPQLSTAIKYLTDRHTFSLVLSNTQYISADGIVSNTDRTLSDLIIGFSITRELSF
jgi:hypothetical protein